MAKKRLVLKRFDVRKGDTIVAQTDLILDKDQVIALRERLEHQFRHLNVNIAVISAGIKLRILRKRKHGAR